MGGANDLPSPLLDFPFCTLPSPFPFGGTKGTKGSKDTEGRSPHFAVVPTRTPTPPAPAPSLDGSIPNPVRGGARRIGLERRLGCESSAFERQLRPSPVPHCRPPLSTPPVSCARSPTNMLRDMDVRELRSSAHPRTQSRPRLHLLRSPTKTRAPPRRERRFFCPNYLRVPVPSSASSDTRSLTQPPPPTAELHLRSPPPPPAAAVPRRPPPAVPGPRTSAAPNNCTNNCTNNRRPLRCVRRPESVAPTSTRRHSRTTRSNGWWTSWGRIASGKPLSSTC